MSVTEDYCSFEVAKLLKEKGFDENIKTCYHNNKFWEYSCNKTYNGNLFKFEENEYSAPTHQMALKYLRKTYKVHFEILYRANRYEVFIMTIEELPKCICRGITGKTYEEAVDKALKYYLTNQI